MLAILFMMESGAGPGDPIYTGRDHDAADRAPGLPAHLATLWNLYQFGLRPIGTEKGFCVSYAPRPFSAASATTAKTESAPRASRTRRDVPGPGPCGEAASLTWSTLSVSLTSRITPLHLWKEPRPR